MCRVFASLVARKFQPPSMRGIKDRVLAECTGSSFLATLFCIYHLSHSQLQFYTRGHKIKLFADKIRVEMGRSLLGDQWKGSNWVQLV
jgi:hypothetical protein